MTPDKIAKSNSEHAHQAALFCWAAMAQRYGFDSAFEFNDLYNVKLSPVATPRIPDLRWLHAVPNGGARGDSKESNIIRGGMLKAEGVKKGVADVFWPLNRGAYCGLYIEMKRPATDTQRAGELSQDQIEFAEFVKLNSYYFTSCFNWRDAAFIVRDYYYLKRG